MVAPSRLASCAERLAGGLAVRIIEPGFGDATSAEWGRGLENGHDQPQLLRKVLGPPKPLVFRSRAVQWLDVIRHEAL